MNVTRPDGDTAAGSVGDLPRKSNSPPLVLAVMLTRAIGAARDPSANCSQMIVDGGLTGPIGPI